jgi:hypothetical protein
VSETLKEQSDRQLIELLTELRVALPGAQVLLGFLLTVPFATRFGRISELDRAVLFVCTLVTAAGVLLLMAPSVYHRVRWTSGGKVDVVRVGHRLFLAGTACLAVGLLCAVFVTGDVLYGPIAATTAVVLGGGLVAWIWYLLPAHHGHAPEVRSLE